MTTNPHFNDPVTYISDCCDENTKGRLKARLATFFPGSNIIFVGVPTDFEAAINLVDIVDAYDGQPGVVLVNVARREGESKKRWQNGPPFGWIKNSSIPNLDIFTTIDGYCISLLQKLTEEKLTVDVYDIPSVVPHMDLDKETQERIINTQFRSFDYLPRLAATLIQKGDLPITEHFSSIPEMPHALCWVDSFGNVKTNMLPEEVGFEVGRDIVIRLNNSQQLRLTCYDRLKDIPDGEIGYTIGSSGLFQKRFIEIMKQGSSVARALNLRSGTTVEIVGVV